MNDQGIKLNQLMLQVCSLELLLFFQSGDEDIKKIKKRLEQWGKGHGSSKDTYTKSYWEL